MKKIALLLSFLISASSAYAKLPAKLPKDYQSWDGRRKLDVLWDKRIVPSEWNTLPALDGPGWGGIVAQFKSLVSLGLSFDLVSDEMPEGRTKVIHPYGSVAKVEFQAEQGSPYTGIYQGAEGLARLSLAGNPKQIGYTPGVALKFLINGKPSVNLHVMQSVNGQGLDQNFFANEFSNIIPEAKGAALKLGQFLFSLVKRNPGELSVEHLALLNASGEKPGHPVAPAQLFFVPAAEAISKIKSDTARDFRNELGDVSKFAEGDVLYAVWAKKTSAEPRTLIGRLILRSRFVPSSYGDHSLFFQHNR